MIIGLCVDVRRHEPKKLKLKRINGYMKKTDPPVPHSSNMAPNYIVVKGEKRGVCT